MSSASSLARDLVRQFEGFSLVPYPDCAGLWTVGYGHLLGANRSVSAITQERADELWDQDFGRAQRAVQRFISAPLNERQDAALISFTFNLGAGSLQRSTLRLLLNRRDYQGAADQFLLWDRAGGRRVFGLTRRRIAERTLFLS